MTKKLTLNPRQPVGDGVFAWHDGYVLINALTMLSSKKTPAQAMAWMLLAGKIEMAMETRGGERKTPPTLAVEITNQEAKALWKAITGKIPNEWYGRDMNGRPAPVSAGLLYLMLRDLSEQLGKPLPDAEFGSDEIDEGDNDEDDSE